MARTRRLHRSGSSGLRSSILKRHRNLKALRLRLVAARQPFGPFCTACRRKRRWTCSSKERHPGRLRTRQQIRPKSWRGWCSSNTWLLNRSRARVARSKVTFFIGRCRLTRTLSLKGRRGGLRIQRSHRRALTPKARRKTNIEYWFEVLPRAQAGVIGALSGLRKIPEILAGRGTPGHPRELAIASLWRQMGPKAQWHPLCPRRTGDQRIYQRAMAYLERAALPPESE